MKFVDDFTLAEVCNAKINSHKLPFYLCALDYWCKVNDMPPKPSKCHVMHVIFFEKSHPAPTTFTWWEALQVVDHMKLFGLEIQNSLGWDIQVKKHDFSCWQTFIYFVYFPQMWSASRGYTGRLSNLHQAHFGIRLRCLHPAFTKQQSHQLERIQKRSCKIILGNNYQDYQSALLDLKITSLADRRETLIMKFGQEVLDSGRHRHLLPAQRFTVHDFRRSNKFPTPLCKTKRFQNSTVPYVILVLNYYFQISFAFVMYLFLDVDIQLFMYLSIACMFVNNLLFMYVFLVNPRLFSLGLPNEILPIFTQGRSMPTLSKRPGLPCAPFSALSFTIAYNSTDCQYFEKTEHGQSSISLRWGLALKVSAIVPDYNTLDNTLVEQIS